MQYMKKGLTLLKKGDLKTLARGAFRILCRKLYLIWARIEDWRIGGVSLSGWKLSRFPETGAYGTESTDYRWMNQIFKSYPLREDAVFVDVGCGEGRVLTYLYLRGFRGKMTGIELDPEIAETARQRTKTCPNIQIRQGNVLECGDILQDATALYLFNPFNETVLKGFVDLIEAVCDHPLFLYYSHDRHRQVLDKRENWYILRRNVVKSYYHPNTTYTIYYYRPNR